MVEMTCEVCGKNSARRDDVLCADCSHAYRILVDLLYQHPELNSEDLGRIKEIFEWRTKKLIAQAEARE